MRSAAKRMNVAKTRIAVVWAGSQALQSTPRSRAQAAVIAAIGLVRRAVDLRLEPVKDGA
jgi:hypothetical protein